MKMIIILAFKKYIGERLADKELNDLAEIAIKIIEDANKEVAMAAVRSAEQTLAEQKNGNGEKI